ncbi:MAG: hypothetical protein WAS21_02700 [Geminicoccaceae bacterium]
MRSKDDVQPRSVGAHPLGQSSVLARIGLLDRGRLPITGAVQAR